MATAIGVIIHIIFYIGNAWGVWHNRNKASENYELLKVPDMSSSEFLSVVIVIAVKALAVWLLFVGGESSIIAIILTTGLMLHAWYYMYDLVIGKKDEIVVMTERKHRRSMIRLFADMIAAFFLAII